jgi:acyl-CoA thioester hydrolase
VNWDETEITVRFNEVDAYSVAWHGHYIAWMEVGRNKMAGKFGIDAEQLIKLGFLAPVVKLELKYLKPTRFNEKLKIRTTLKKGETATLEFLSEIIGEDGKLCAKGSTIHVLTDMAGTIQYRLSDNVEKLVHNVIVWAGEDS